MINKPVDIIIPIYNAADDLEVCLESIYRNTDLSRNRLVLINDNSPDSRIKEILDSQNKENVIVIHNEKNQGFSANINLGMQQSEENDVLLLNSDTVVTKGWIEKIVQCAYSAEEIGTVTPLSNNATLCSVPVFCEENKLPEGYDADGMADLVERCSMKKYPQISVAHGFCMFVKREVINKVGYFDAETFGRGYGEENDFCNRAEQVGYIHVQCDDTFILHTGTKSFVSAEKEKYIREHDAILRKRYPKQMHANDVYVRDNPNGFIQENIGTYLDAENGKKNILYVIHTDFRKDASNNVGGTQLHVNHLKDKMIDKYNVFVAARDEEYLNLTLYTDEKEHFWKFKIGEYKEFFKFHDRNLKKIWNLLFDAFNFDVVHIHHVYSLSFDIFDIAEQRDIPIILTCHDYFFISPSLKLLDEGYKIIDKEKMTDEKWKNALNYWAGIYEKTEYISLWQLKCREMLLKCKDVIVPDVTVKHYLTEYYPDVESRIKVIPHGYDFNNCEDEILVDSDSIRYYIENIKKKHLGYIIEGWGIKDDLLNGIDRIYLEVANGEKSYRLPVTNIPRADVVGTNGVSGKGFRVLVPNYMTEGGATVDLLIKSENIFYRKSGICKIKAKNYSINELNVGFIGGIGKEKGASLICDLIKKSNSDVNYYVFGNLGHEGLSVIESNHVYKFDKYDSNDLPALFEAYKIDVVCILSIWPETFSYTLSEAVLCGKPVIVVDTGAVGERMKALKAGWTVSLDNACNDIIGILDNIKNDRKLLSEKKTIAVNAKLRTLSEMAVDYDNLYSKVMKNETKSYNAFDAEFLYNHYVDRKYFINAADETIINNGLSPDDKAVINSMTFKIVRRIRKINFPLKKQLWIILNRGR